MKNLFLVPMILLLSVLSCVKDEIQDPIIIDNGGLVSLSGTYSLLNVSGGFSGVSDDFPYGAIKWEFDNVSQTVCIINLNEEEVIHDGYPTGEYSYSIIVTGAHEYLVIDKFELGLMTFEGVNLSIDQNMLSTGGGADGFQYYFGPYNEDPETSPILSGEYDLYQVTGGFAGVDDVFGSGLITWNFNASIGILSVENNNQEEVIHDGFVSGGYTYEIIEDNGDHFLMIESFEMGRIEFICNELFINGDHWIDTSVDDAFSYSFGPCAIDFGLWNVKHRWGGIAGLDIAFDDGVITWDFDVDNQEVIIVNQLDQPSQAGWSSGTYSYSVAVVDDQQFISIDNVEMGLMQIAMGQMFLDGNDLSGGGSVDDGMQFLLEQ